MITKVTKLFTRQVHVPASDHSYYTQPSPGHSQSVSWLGLKKVNPAGQPAMVKTQFDFKKKILQNHVVLIIIF
jgi:hypothetical protein